MPKSPPCHANVQTKRHYIYPHHQGGAFLTLLELSPRQFHHIKQQHHCVQEAPKVTTEEVLVNSVISIAEAEFIGFSFADFGYHATINIPCLFGCSSNERGITWSEKPAL